MAGGSLDLTSPVFVIDSALESISKPLEMLSSILLAQCTVTLRVTERLLLPPYKGSTLRGGFGHALRRVVCPLKRMECPQCRLYKSCIYAYLFETPLPENSPFLRKQTIIPHPFVFDPPLDRKREYEKGETLFFGFTVIGRAVEYLPYFVYAFSEMGRSGIGKGRGTFAVKEVISGEELLYSEEDKALKRPNLRSFVFRSSPYHGTITLTFLTPTRIKFNGRLLLDLDFHHLIRNLLRRIWNLSYFHCGKALEIDFKALIEKAERVKTVRRDLSWLDLERYSARQDRRMKLGGFIGSVVFEGDLGEFMPFLELGEIVHVGKGTSFGLGRYEIAKG